MRIGSLILPTLRLFGILFLESLHPSFRIDDFLRSREEWVTVGANINV